MTAVKSRDAERFIAAPPEGVFLFLVFGADAGMVRERALALVENASTIAAIPSNSSR